MTTGYDPKVAAEQAAIAFGEIIQRILAGSIEAVNDVVELL